jgi:hypothetical protein
LPSIMIGIVASCTGVGSFHPIFSIDCIILGSICNVSKLDISLTLNGPTIR